MIKLSAFSMGNQEIEAVSRVIQSGRVSMGLEVRDFEQELEGVTKRPVSCVSTGTSALHIALQALGIGAGDSVLVPTLTYVACFQAVTATGAVPIACDIDPNTGFIDPKDAKKRLTATTKAIMPVHFAGSLRGIEDIYTLAKEAGLRVVEDGAHSFGGMHAGHPVGSQGDVMCFSFDGIKNITSVEGGAVVSGDKSVIQHVNDCRLLGVQGDTAMRYGGKRSWDFDVVDQGWRYHMNELHAAIGRVQLSRLGEFKAIRTHLIQTYLKNLETLPHVKPLDLPYNEMMPHIFMILVDAHVRKDLCDFLTERGVQVGFHYRPNHFLTRFKGPSLPASEEFHTKSITLPLQCEMSEHDVHTITQALHTFYHI